MSKYISATETAKLVRQALKEAFPGVRFSVRTEKYAGGATIHVWWTDGPTADKVRMIAQRFEGSYTDPRQDYMGHRVHQFNGQRVSFGANFVTCHRTYSAAFLKDVIARTWERYGLDRLGVPRPRIAQGSQGAYVHDPELKLPEEIDGTWYAQTLIDRAAQRTPGGSYPGRSALAEAVQEVARY